MTNTNSEHLERASVMVVDDDPFTLKLHAHVLMLEQFGFSEIRTFNGGEEALAALREGWTPSLILLDLSMPGMDGIEFLRHLVPAGYIGGLILISGEDERLLQSSSRLVRAHGMNLVGHLAKPMKPGPLKALIEAWQTRVHRKKTEPGRVYSKDEIRHGIRERQIVNFYQPKVEVRSGRLIGVEALARWQHPEEGLVGPGSFIPIAEQVGLAEDLTRLVFTTGVRDIRALEVAGLPLQVAINLAPAALESLNLADFLASETVRAELLPQNIMLELTESQVLGDLRESLDVLTRLRLKRFKLSIDDFGTGYSSLAQLSELPFDELKIDQKFVHDATTDATARAIYDASLGLAKRLNMKTVAEGVENANDWKFVRTTACDIAQGYFIGRPMPPASLPEWADAWRARLASLTDPLNT